MPDRSTFWSPVPDWAETSLEAPGLSVEAVRPAAMRLLSGQVDALPAEFGAGKVCGPRDTIDTKHYTLRLAPDCVLLVSETPLSGATGWHEAGFAVSEFGDGMVCFDLGGIRARELLACGTEYDFLAAPTAPRESARMLLGGVRVAVARHAAGWRLHVERPWATALWQWLQACAKPWADRP